MDAEIQYLEQKIDIESKFLKKRINFLYWMVGILVFNVLMILALLFL